MSLLCGTLLSKCQHWLNKNTPGYRFYYMTDDRMCKDSKPYVDAVVFDVTENYQEEW